jgi:hypothetical protein
MKKNKKKGNVYVVVAMDTEGPIVNKKKPEIISTWSDTKKLILNITDKKFRKKFPDSQNTGLIFSWFILTLTGFKTNPYKRPMKYHENFDFYLKNFSKNFKENKDGIYWHYHQPSKSGIGNEWSNDWFASNEYMNILNKLITERNFFPCCFRAGGRIEDNNLSHWLEEFFPFDFSNCSGNINWNRIESDGKRLKDVADWSRASRKWQGYNPSHENYQKKGTMRRFIFRSVDLKSPVYKLKENDIIEAFELAEKGQDSLLSVFEHDRRFNLIENLEEFLFKLSNISKKYKRIKFLYSNAQNAALKTNGLKEKIAPKFKFIKTKDDRLMIKSDSDIFGSRPYVCLKKKNNITELPVNKIGVNMWLTQKFKKKDTMEIFVVANNFSGNNKVQKYIFYSK